MKNDEFAFFNQQLATMVRDGIPLEGALHRLCADMQRGPLRKELEKLGADLAQGIPLREATRARQLPELYQRMLEVGAQSNDLPAVLTLLADHYQRRHAIWTRLKGLMVYPVIVLCGAFLLSCTLGGILHLMMQSYILPSFGDVFPVKMPTHFIAYWLSPALLGVSVLAMFAALTIPALRRMARWQLPAFREASLSQVASALALMLRNGVPLDTALALAERLEEGTPAEVELGQWRQRLASGRGKFSELASGGKVFPPLFVWMVAHSGEDWAAGFERASETYQSRANYRTELLLYSAMPCSILLLGMMIMIQIQPLFNVFLTIMRMLGNPGGM